MKQHSFSFLLCFLLFLPGLGCVIFGSYIVVENIYHQLMWKRTTGKIIDTVAEFTSDGNSEFNKVLFTDDKGKKHEVVSRYSNGSSDVDIEWKKSDTATVYFNPENSHE